MIGSGEGPVWRKGSRPHRRGGYALEQTGGTESLKLGDGDILAGANTYREGGKPRATRSHR